MQSNATQKRLSLDQGIAKVAMTKIGHVFGFAFRRQNDPFIFPFRNGLFWPWKLSDRLE